MTMLKKFVPIGLKRLALRTRWFLQHYSNINKSTTLLGNHHSGKITFDTDGLTTSNNADFIREPKFAKAYAAAAATNPWPNFTLQWRVYIVCWFANLVKGLPGDFVECGVNTGAYSRAIIDYIDFNSLGKQFYLFDTYDGLVDTLVTEEEKKAGISKYLNGHYKDVYQQVAETFKNFNVKIIKGIVPDSLKNFGGHQICYLSIDMNCVAPEIAAADFFWDKLVTGGVIILDDYGFPDHFLQKQAFDEFAKKKNVSILSLPTGQGIIIKQ
jgi:O-methyltransferase